MNVLVTRPDQRGQHLFTLLSEQQIFAIYQPIFTLEAGEELTQLPSAMMRLNAGDYVFAVSRNAVKFAQETLKQTGFHWRNDLVYFAVGQGSANYFSAKIENAVHYPIQSENSEALLDLPEMQDLQGKQILILRADSGRTYFAEQATLRGAAVQYLECYRRIMSENLAEKLSLAKRAGIDTIVITSGEMLSVLVEQTAENDRSWLMSCRLVVVGQRIARFARRLGWAENQIYISDKADNLSLLETLLSYREF